MSVHGSEARGGRASSGVPDPLMRNALCWLRFQIDVWIGHARWFPDYYFGLWWYFHICRPSVEWRECRDLSDLDP
jgi:hypothetical protein